MIDHVSLGVRDIAASKIFYEALLAPLGYRVLVDRGVSVAFGKAYPEICRVPWPFMNRPSRRSAWSSLSRGRRWSVSARPIRKSG